MSKRLSLRGDDKRWVPEWAKKVVWYQIFPERYRNGDVNNDPTIEDIRGAWPHDASSPWQIHPWTCDWYELQPYEKVNGHDIWYNIERRRFGGDLQGIIDKLDYVQDLGIGALYLNPVFESPSSHKYDGSTYHHIDPNFGPDLGGDRRLMDSEVPDKPSTWVWTSADNLALELIRQVHERGMRIIFDGVFNHMGLNSWAFRDVQENQIDSKYSHWFSINSWDNPGSGERFDYNGWFGYKELPELKQDENGIVKGPREYIFAATQRWMDPFGDSHPENGIDGWRLDVAFCIKHPFWKKWRSFVKSVNPEAYLTAEVIDPVHVLKPYLQGDEFDAVMNYNFAFICSDYFINEKKRIKTSDFDKRLKKLRNAFPDGVSSVMQNLFDSHDSNRIGSHIVNRDQRLYRGWSKYHIWSKGRNLQYDTRKPTQEELESQKLFAIFQMTYTGAPMIYYGDEVGMWGANDPCCRKPMLWDDMSFDAEVYLPDGSKRESPDIVKVNHDLYEHYKKLIHIRNNNLALQTGEYDTIIVDDERELFGFKRHYSNQYVYVILNNSEIIQNVGISGIVAVDVIDVLNDNKRYLKSQDSSTLQIAPRWGCILVPIITL